MKTVEQMIYARLSGDGTLTGLAPGGVWRGVAPTDKPVGTWIVFNSMTADDIYTFDLRAMVNSVYQIKAITPGESALPAWQAAERVETLLTDQALTINSGTLLMVRRQQVISLTETDGGEQYQHAGGMYAITVQE